jgi:probable rRNA maturation factor
VNRVYITNQQRTKKLSHRRIIRDLNKTLLLLGFQKAELSILFVNNEKMKFLNARYRGVDRITDILSFPQQREKRRRSPGLTAVNDNADASGNTILGDLVICIPRAVSQAKKIHVSIYDELLRLFIHGLLHLLGYHHEKNTYQKRKMQNKERELLLAHKTVKSLA